MVRATAGTSAARPCLCRVRGEAGGLADDPRPLDRSRSTTGPATQRHVAVEAALAAAASANPAEPGAPGGMAAGAGAVAEAAGSPPAGAAGSPAEAGSPPPVGVATPVSLASDPPAPRRPHCSGCGWRPPWRRCLSSPAWPLPSTTRECSSDHPTAAPVTSVVPSQAASAAVPSGVPATGVAAIDLGAYQDPTALVAAVQAQVESSNRARRRRGRRARSVVAPGLLPAPTPASGARPAPTPGCGVTVPRRWLRQPRTGVGPARVFVFQAPRGHIVAVNRCARMPSWSPPPPTSACARTSTGLRPAAMRPAITADHRRSRRRRPCTRQVSPTARAPPTSRCAGAGNQSRRASVEGA